MTTAAGRARRHLLRLLLIVVLALAAGVVTAGPAAADICQDAPAPVAPKSGLPGMLTDVPQNVPDAAPDPFKDPKVPIGDVYGFNWGWANFDLGCGADFLRDPIAVTNTKSANVVMAVVGGVLAGLSSLEEMAKTSSLAWFTTVVAGVAEKLKGPLLTVWLPLGVLGVGLILAYQAKRAAYANTLRTALVVLGAIAMATFALVYPATASRAVDNTVVAVSDAVGKQFSASASDAVTRESAYRTWLTGNFGDPDSAMARELGPRLMSATHYTWSDMKRIQADPGAKKGIDQAKAAEFKAVAKQIKDRDPGAYEMFTGRGERTSPALLGVLVVLCMGLFIALAMLMVLIARVMMQGLALAAPVAAVLGVLPTHTSVLARLWDLFTAAIVAVAKFVIAGGVMALVLGAIQTNDGLGAGAKLFWVVVATVVGIVLTRPIHSFKTIVPGLDPNKSYVRAALSNVATYVGVRMGAEDGIEAGLPTSNPAPADKTKEKPTASPDARDSLEPLPKPAWAHSPAAGPVWVQVPAVDESAAHPRPAGVNQMSLPAMPSADAAANTGKWTSGQTWPGVVAGGPARPQLPAAPLRLETAAISATPAAVDAHAAPAADLNPTVNASTGSDDGPGPVSVGPAVSIGPAVPVSAVPVGWGVVGSDTVVDAPVTGSGNHLSVVTESGPVVDPAVTSRAQQKTAEVEKGEPGVVYPSGVIVAAEEVPLYQRTDEEAPKPSEVYIVLPEPELAEDGTEHEMVTYHSSAGTAHGPA